MALHSELAQCPYQIKAISKGLQRYVISSPELCAEIARSVFKEWGFGPYWSVAVQLTHPAHRSQISGILARKQDRDQAAHALVMHFINNPNPIDSNSLTVADMALY